VKGGRFQLDEAPPEEPGMLMTSMIDVIFILLAFFVCVTELKQSALEIDVPEVPAADAQAEEETAEPILVEVTADDRIYVEQEEAQGPEDLNRLLGRLVAERGADAPVHLSGDKEASNGAMMRVVSHLSQAGLKRIEFAVQAGG
jgi:biopolymer transport protein ExbD